MTVYLCDIVVNDALGNRIIVFSDSGASEIRDILLADGPEKGRIWSSRRMHLFPRLSAVDRDMVESAVTDRLMDGFLSCTDEFGIRDYFVNHGARVITSTEMLMVLFDMLDKARRK